MNRDPSPALAASTPAGRWAFGGPDTWQGDDRRSAIRCDPGGRQGSLASVTLGAGKLTSNLQVQADGNNFRIVFGDAQTRVSSMVSIRPPWPSNWLYPSDGRGYAATLGDNGKHPVRAQYGFRVGREPCRATTILAERAGSMGFATGRPPSRLSIQVKRDIGRSHCCGPGQASSADDLGPPPIPAKAP